MRERLRQALGLYLVTDAGHAGERGVEAVTVAALAGGAGAVQLRDDAMPGDELARLARRLQAHMAGLPAILIVNNRLDVALAVGADGVHLGQADTDVVIARRALGPGGIVGLSITDPDQIARMPEDVVDYLGVGPIFATATKPDAAAPMGLEGLRRCRDLAPDLPIVAIGGIDAGNAAEVMAAGADGIAVVSAICAAGDPEAAARHLALIVETARSGRGTR